MLSFFQVPDAANLYTVLNTLVLTLGPIIATVITYFLTKERAIRIDAKTSEIHTLVNGQREAAQARISALEAENAKLKAGVSA